METAVCKMCKRLFTQVSAEPICPSCNDKLEVKLKEVKDYLWEHKTAPLAQISKDCDVTYNQLNRWVREDRLAFSEDSPVVFQCDGCGADIKSGRFCPKCGGKLEKKFNALWQTSTAPNMRERDRKNRMRFLDN